MPGFGRIWVIHSKVNFKVGKNVCGTERGKSPKFLSVQTCSLNVCVDADCCLRRAVFSRTVAVHVMVT
jgi:hypothetical protein